MTRCVCKKQLREGDRIVELTLKVDWSDARGKNVKDAAFCSFKCVADWANGLAARHDGRRID